ncbi:MAG: hypothetical protein HY619_00640 [Thaumarchaeota archaeon]|nr:hypothetical protein [Nitrososphaerota archaeon]
MSSTGPTSFMRADTAIDPPEIDDQALGDLLTRLEEELARKKERLESYEKRLGDLLRTLEGNRSFTDNPVTKELMLSGGKDSKKDKKHEKNGNDWINFQGLMLYKGDARLGEAQVHFDSLAALRDEIFALEEISKATKSLINSGLKPETPCLVFRGRGLAYKLVLRRGDGSGSTKLSYQGRFLVR